MSKKIKKTEHTVIDDAFQLSLIERLNDKFLSTSFPWYYSPSVAKKTSSDGIHFTHFIFSDHSPRSEYFDDFFPILNFLGAKSLIRMKINLFPKTDKVFEHDWHTDYPFSHKGALLYLNTNDGYTTLQDGSKIESVQNRVLLFDPGIVHKSSTCSNENVRLNIQINYF